VELGVVVVLLSVLLGLVVESVERLLRLFGFVFVVDDEFGSDVELLEVELLGVVELLVELPGVV
jgi:hypothetical protein